MKNSGTKRIFTNTFMFAILDTETTGGKPIDDRITEIAIFIHNGKRVVESFSTLINPCRKIDPFVSGMTGITNEMVADAPKFEEVAQKIWELTEGKIFVAHNARFDYGMLRNEYRRLGKIFTRKQLCTVKLARKIIPGMQSYSLGKLCDDIGIKLNNRHRAYGDAEATVLLFEKLLLNDRKEVIRTELNEGLEDNILPPNINRSKVEHLPEEPGVYYFLDQSQKVIYIGKSSNIYKRVISHFSNDIKTEKGARMKERIHEISYQLTGSELVAMLVESDEIKRKMPEFNVSQRIKKYRQGVFLRTDEHGFYYFKAENLKVDEAPLLKATTPRVANKMVDDLNFRHNLRAYTTLISKLKNLGTLEQFAASHNEKIESLIQTFYYEHPNFFIVNEAVNPDERTLIWVENNEYKGFGNINIQDGFEDIELLKEKITYKKDNPDIKSILRAWLKKNKKTMILKY
jgi:DNA polymerase-3 subunit epsilon